MTHLPELSPDAFTKVDQSGDILFYAGPRFVTHIDEGAIAAVTELYRDLFQAGGIILDLMGSWVSYLPEEVAYTEVSGHGMNKAELATNPRLSRFFVQDLNENPVLMLGDKSVDAAGV